MTDSPKTSLRKDDIRTTRLRGRRAFLGLAAGGGAAVLTGTATAQAADADTGEMADPAACPRGPGGEYTGVTDSDGGATADLGGYGRGPVQC